MIGRVMTRALLMVTHWLPATVGPFEVRAGLFPILLGLWLLWPSATFGTAIGYAVLNRLLPETGWALLLIAVGVLQLLLALRRAPLMVRRALALALVGLWMVWVVSFGVANILSLGVPAYLLAALDQAVIYLRLGLNGTQRHE